MNIDVICLTNTNDQYFYDLTNTTLDTLLSTEGDYNFNIKLIESNKKSEFKYNQPNLVTIIPKEEFHYNRFLNIGLKECNGEWVLIINNDLVFTKDWLNNIMSEHRLNPDIVSFSPFEPNFAEYHNPSLYKEGNVYVGYTTKVELLGWCILVKKSVLDTIGNFDERFNFWCQDDDYGLTLKKHNFKHAIIKDSIVYHVESQSYTLIKKEDLYFKTQLMAK